MAETKVLINDGMDDEGIKVFHDAGIKTDTVKRDPVALVRDINEYDALAVRSATKVTREVIEAGVRGKLKIVGRAGVGLDNINVNAASENGIVVKWAPYGNTNSAAEMALGLMFAVARNIPQANTSLRSGIWQKKPYRGVELSRKTLGIVGVGRIGFRLSQLVRGLDMRVIGYDTKPNRELPIEFVSLDELLKESDFVSIHTGGKQQVIGDRQILLMKPTAYLINASRGDNIDPGALYAALEIGKIAGAGLDVHVKEGKEDEPFDSIFKDFPNVVLTPHLGASTSEAQVKTSQEMARVMTGFLVGTTEKELYENAVNVGETIASEDRPLYRLVIFHEDKPGAFARIDIVLADGGINIREPNSRQIGNAQGRCVHTTYFLPNPVSNDVLAKIRELDFVRRAIA